MPNTNSRLAGDDRQAQKRIAENDKPMTPGQLDELPETQSNGYLLACRDVDGQECSYEAAGSSVDEIRDSMMRHYVDKHPGHKIEDALEIALTQSRL